MQVTVVDDDRSQRLPSLTVTLNRRQALYVIAAVMVIAVILSAYPSLAQELGAKSSVPTASVSGTFTVVSGDGTKDGVPDVTVSWPVPRRMKCLSRR